MSQRGWYQHTPPSLSSLNPSHGHPDYSHSHAVALQDITHSQDLESLTGVHDLPHPESYLSRSTLNLNDPKVSCSTYPSNMHQSVGDGSYSYLHAGSHSATLSSLSGSQGNMSWHHHYDGVVAQQPNITAHLQELTSFHREQLVPQVTEPTFADDLGPGSSSSSYDHHHSYPSYTQVSTSSNSCTDLHTQLHLSSVSERQVFRQGAGPELPIYNPSLSTFHNHSMGTTAPALLPALRPVDFSSEHSLSQVAPTLSDQSGLGVSGSIILDSTSESFVNMLGQRRMMDDVYPQVAKQQKFLGSEVLPTSIPTITSSESPMVFVPFLLIKNMKWCSDRQTVGKLNLFEFHSGIRQFIRYMSFNTSGWEDQLITTMALGGTFCSWGLRWCINGWFVDAISCRHVHGALYITVDLAATEIDFGSQAHNHPKPRAKLFENTSAKGGSQVAMKTDVQNFEVGAEAPNLGPDGFQLPSESEEILCCTFNDAGGDTIVIRQSEDQPQNMILNWSRAVYSGHFDFLEGRGEDRGGSCLFCVQVQVVTVTNKFNCSQKTIKTSRP
ncbi:uncharacterized protein EDB93DRAFT_1106201 [Suillus bovinus]|uniref:uncharacterized protein n=1 Tax=Suillus bovinus TaxID=48563 RepID=UPI001B875754|nr:uncharacterized protein EDB93DRAFT_1106201 [Suillus bovinus]KAG2139094.1 hypothetical protein EDB93DRAFT_1106201 [Suillus bovinus]